MNTHQMNHTKHSRGNALRFRTPARRGNLLVGCLAVLGVVVVLAIIATIFVVRSYRGWVAKGIDSTASAMLVEMQIDDQESSEIMAHIQTLLTKYTSKEINNEEFFGVFGELVQSPLVAAAALGVIEKMYFDESGLSDEEKATAHQQLQRYASGLFEKQIEPDSLETVLASISTNTPDSDDIVIHHQTGPGGMNQLALRSADEVSDDDLRELVAQAQAAADEAGIEANPAEIDLSDTLGIAIATAIGEDPSEWVPNADDLLEPGDPVEQTPVDDDEPTDDTTGDDGP